MPNKSQKRDLEKKRRYMREYNARPEQKKKRAMRNKARRKAIREGRASKGDGMDVHHIKPMAKGGTNKDGVRVISRSKNRGHHLAIPKKKKR